MTEKRKCKRFILPGASISYEIHGFLGHRKPSPEKTYFLIDLSKGGLGFLTNKPPKTGTKISILLHFSDDEEPISLEGTVVYSMLNVGIIAQYRVGVEFKPYGDEKGFNSRKALDKLDELEKIYSTS